MKLSVVIPVYNEKDTIREIIQRVKAVDIDKEIIIVDDFSTDGRIWETVKEENSAMPLLRSFIEHPKAVEFAVSFIPANGRFVKITPNRGEF